MIMRLTSIFLDDPVKFNAEQVKVDESQLRDLLVLSLFSVENKMGDTVD